MTRIKPEFRAMRETLGLTQQTLADELGVKILSVKRWESPKYPQQAPQDAWDFLDELERQQVILCNVAIAKAAQRQQDSTESLHDVQVPYWSSASDYEASRGSEGVTWTEANATSRRLAIMLLDRGASVVWVDGSTCIDSII